MRSHASSYGRSSAHEHRLELVEEGGRARRDRRARRRGGTERTSWNSGRAKSSPTRAEEAGERGHEHGRDSRGRRRARPRAPGRRRRRRSARSRAGRGPSRTRPTAARASCARSRSRGCRAASLDAVESPSGRGDALERASASVAVDRDLAVGERPFGDEAEHDVRVGDGRLRRRRARSTRARASAPARARPDLQAARRVEPGDASRRRRRPRRCRSSGCAAARPQPRISRLPAESEPPTSYSRPRETAPFSISDALAVVPPMSKAIAFAIPEPARHAERGDDAGGRARLEREHRPRSSRRRRS